MEGYDYLLLVLIIIACYWDFRYKRLPNWLTVSGAAAGLVYHLIFQGLSGLMSSLLAGVMAAAIFLVLYLFRAVGAGDVKLFMAIGTLTGTYFVCYCMMYSVLYAGIIAVIFLLFTRTFMKRMVQAFHRLLFTWMMKDLGVLEEYKKTESTRFAFMYAVVPAVFTTAYSLYY